MKKSLSELFIQLASPNENGVSRWVYVDEFVGEYESLKLGNGGSWCRRESPLAKRYNIELNKSISKGVSIDAIRLNGYKTEETFNQTIRKDIRDFYKTQKCVMLGINGKSENTKIEIDHKDGRKNDFRVADLSQQTLNDFPPLCKAANDVKRQICKRCKETDKRWDAKNIKGNPYSFYEGDENYTEGLGCVGCYQYDPVAYRMECAKKISQEASEYIMRRLYPEE